MEIKYTSKLTQIDISKLHLRYVPHVEPLHLYNDDMSLKASPHVEMLYLIGTYGFDWDRIKESRYGQILEYKHVMGVGGYDRNDILDNLNKAWRTYSSIATRGMRDRRSVIILKKPFWATRFGHKKIKGMEIWKGVWVCAAACFLGMKTVKGRMAEDAYPGSGVKGIFEEMYKGVEGVFDGE